MVHLVTYIHTVLIRDAPIIGIGRLSAILPIIGIGRLLRRYQPVWKRVGCCRVKRWPSVAMREGWRHWCGEGYTARVVTGQWSTTPCNPSQRHPSRHPARVHRQCWIIQCELRAFVLFLELFVLIGYRCIHSFHTLKTTENSHSNSHRYYQFFCAQSLASHSHLHCRDNAISAVTPGTSQTSIKHNMHIGQLYHITGIHNIPVAGWKSDVCS